MIKSGKKIFKMLGSTDPKVIGCKDGRSLVMSSSPLSENFKKRNPYSEFRITEPFLDSFSLLDKYKVIDCFTHSSYRSEFVISEKMKGILLNFNLYSTQLIPSVVYSQKEALKDYYFLHCYSYLLDKFDYGKIKFSRIWPYPREVEEKYFDMDEKKLLSECKEIAGRMVYIEPDNGYQFKGFDYTAYDLFRIGELDEYIYVSERLKNDLVDAKISGIEFVESDLFRV